VEALFGIGAVGNGKGSVAIKRCTLLATVNPYCAHSADDGNKCTLNPTSTNVNAWSVCGCIVEVGWNRLVP